MKINISCLVDDSPKFRLQAWNWILSLKSVATEANIFIHHTPGAIDTNDKVFFSRLGATVIEVPIFGDGPGRYCNKIQQLKSAEFLDADFLILSDADIFYTEDPVQLIEPDHFCAKLVDLPNPCETVWTKLLAKYVDRKEVTLRPLELMPTSKTIQTNFNGGLYIIPSYLVRKLAPTWEYYARACLLETELLGQKLHHSDQIGMALALLNANCNIKQLPAGANLPTHLGSRTLRHIAPQKIYALHYHSNTDNHGRPAETGVKWIDLSIDSSRKNLDSLRRNFFSHKIFQEYSCVSKRFSLEVFGTL